MIRYDGRYAPQLELLRSIRNIYPEHSAASTRFWRHRDTRDSWPLALCHCIRHWPSHRVLIWFPRIVDAHGHQSMLAPGLLALDPFKYFVHGTYYVTNPWRYA